MDARRIAPLVTGLTLGACGSVSDTASEPDGVEMSVFRVPSRHGLAATEADRALPVDEPDEPAVMMPPDIVARPGEEPDEALERALAEGERRERRRTRRRRRRPPR